ncbi:unnamed protein product [Mytilus coruscus]|uniref:Uncharacterized protein n=1 Tax=Mytilus coruscus TaxID=42192 RepID=A0A6J8E574_MYTCO|nr:unnamed protein product [Mytilus coruscus]
MLYGFSFHSVNDKAFSLETSCVPSFSRTRSRHHLDESEFNQTYLSGSSMFEGLWSDNSPDIKDNYFFKPSTYGNKICSGGCNCNEKDNIVTGCSGPTVKIQGYSFENVTMDSFESSVTSIQLLEMPNFKYFGNATFDHLTNLQSLTIHSTSLIQFPDISTTQMEKMMLCDNQIKFFQHNHTNPIWPSTLKRLSLIQNDIEWVPDNFLTLSSIEYVSFSRNSIRYFPSLALKGVTSLIYLGLEENQIRKISKNHLSSVINSPLIHLNLSNNIIDYIEPNGLKQLSSLKIFWLIIAAIWSADGCVKGIWGSDSAGCCLGGTGRSAGTWVVSALARFDVLAVVQLCQGSLEPVNIPQICRELHNNQISRIDQGTFDGIPNLIHLDLIHNHLEVLTSKSFTNLNTLITLRLHSQDTPMKYIYYDAFYNINGNLTNLWISDNELPFFPQQVLSEQEYLAMREIYADNNRIINATEYTQDGFPLTMQHAYTNKKLAYKSWYTLRNLNKLYLGGNLIPAIDPLEFCNLTVLTVFSLRNNLLDDDVVPDNAFDCLTSLVELDIAYNFFKYVPKAAKTIALQDFRILNMAGNKLTAIPAGTFQTVNFTDLVSEEESERDYESSQEDEEDMPEEPPEKRMKVLTKMSKMEKMKKVENILSKKQKLGLAVHEEIAKIIPTKNSGVSSKRDDTFVQLMEKSLKSLSEESEETFELSLDSLNLLLYAHRDLSSQRRKLLTPALDKKYLALSQEDEKILPNYLFGNRENLEQWMKEIDDSTKLGNKMKVKSAWNRDKAHVPEVKDTYSRHDNFKSDKGKSGFKNNFLAKKAQIRREQKKPFSKKGKGNLDH